MSGSASLTLTVEGVQSLCGPQGERGFPGGGITGRYLYDTETADGHPDSGSIRLGAAGFTTAVLRVDNITADSQDLGAALASIAGAENVVKGHMRLVKEADPSVFAIYEVKAVASMLSGAYFNLTVSHLVSANSTMLSAGDVILLFFTRAGDRGELGDLTFTQSGTGAVGRSATDKLKDIISAVDFVPTNLHAAINAGINTTDLTTYLQAAANEAGRLGRLLLIPGPGPWLISSKIQFKTTRDLAAAMPGEAQFSDLTPVRVVGVGGPVIKATAAMTGMFELIFDTSDSDIGPFTSLIEGIRFNGNKLATSGIISNFVIHVTFFNNTFWNLTRGIEVIGYGGFVALQCTFKCKYGFHMVAGGGDSRIDHCDFYFPESDSAGIYGGYYCGNLTINGSTFTNEGGHASSYGVQLDGSTANGGQEIRHVIVSDNEFCGLTAAVKANGKSASTRNVWQLALRGNHVTPFGSYNPGRLGDFTDVDDLLITGNWCNHNALPVASSVQLSLVRARRAIINGNRFCNVTNAAIVPNGCTDCLITDNIFEDVGKGGTSYTCITFFGSTSDRNVVRSNLFMQSSTAYAQNGIFEDDAVLGTTSLDNAFRNILTPHTKGTGSGADTPMRRVEYAASMPTSGNFRVGDFVWNTAPTVSGGKVLVGWVRLTTTNQHVLNTDWAALYATHS